MRSTVVVLLLTLALAGCTVVVESTGRAPAGTRPTAAAQARPAVQPDELDARPGVDEDSREVDEQTAVQVVDEFWRREFARDGSPYDPPRVVGSYTGRNGPTCGGERSVPGNAYYCPSGDFLAWDDDLMAAGYEQVGDAWVYLVIAHEWGHAIQARLSSSQVSRAIELQADCLAGAAIDGAAREGLVRIEEGDEEEIARGLRAVADDFAWTDETSHGNAEERISSFNQGIGGGVQGCL